MSLKYPVRGWSTLSLRKLIQLNDTTVTDALEWNTDAEKLVYQVAILCDIMLGEAQRLSLKEILRVADGMAWLNTPPDPSKIPGASKVKIGKYAYGMASVFAHDSIAKYITIDSLKQKEELFRRVGDLEPDAMLDLLAIVCHELGCPYEGSELAIAQRKDILADMSVTNAIALCNFFFRRWATYTNDMRRSTRPTPS